MSYLDYERKDCVNWKNGAYTLSNPESAGEECLDFEDTIDFLRLKADAIRGTLG